MFSIFPVLFVFHAIFNISNKNKNPGGCVFFCRKTILSHFTFYAIFNINFFLKVPLHLLVKWEVVSPNSREGRTVGIYIHYILYSLILIYRQVPDNDRRRDIVRRDRLCYNCLRRHNVRDCLAKGRCRNCKQKHHTALCNNDSHVKSLDTSLSSDSKQISSGESPCHVKLTPTCISPTGPVLLKTATGTISTDSTNNNVTVNILLDEGAQRTFITQRTVTKLDISHENCVSENITLATFGADNHNEKRVNVVSINLNTISGSNVCLSAIVVPQISSLVRNHVQKTVLKHSYLKVLPLANHVAADDFEIDLLIGADYYWDIVENNTVRGPGPTAVASKLGYLLSGPQIRQVVKYIIQRCVTCLKVIGKPYRKPETPPLPKCRLLESPPFTVCGVDFTGALYYKSDSGSNSKAYICLFTCAVTRAIHLEVVTDMTTQTFLQAFRRFVGRCSLPSQMISDNGSTFLAAAEDIQRLLKDPSINNYMANRSVQWTFIPKRAPWFGGFYERLIGMTKNVLKKTLGRSLVTLNELNTLVVEVEAVINDRPITYVPSDVGEPEPLSPSMLARGHNITMLPHRFITKDDIDDLDYGINASDMQNRLKRLDILYKHCWKRWRSEYLPTLREAHILNAKGRVHSENHIKVGDVVLIHCDTDKRIQWPMAVVTKLHTGIDNLVRSVEIRTKHGISNRPIAKLYPLEVALCEPTECQNISNVDDMVPERTTRDSANKARTLIRKQLNSDSD